MRFGIYYLCHVNKLEHITYWTNTAERDWEAVSDLYNASKYVHCLFFVHLVMEKLAKAHWVKTNEENYPPRIHNIVSLLSKAAIELPEADIIFLADLNKFQLEGRYPDYVSDIYKIVNQETANYYLENVKPIRLCLIEKLH